MLPSLPISKGPGSFSPVCVIPSPLADSNDDDDEIYGVIIDEKSKEIPAKLKCSGIEMIVETTTDEEKYTRRIIISLVGVLEVKVVPAAAVLSDVDEEDVNLPTMPATLIVTYLTDVFDKTSISTVFFSGIRGILDTFAAKIDYIIANLKKNLEFHGPDPNKQRKRSNSIPKKKLKTKTFTLTGIPKIISKPEIETVRLFLPLRYRILSWKLLYQTSQDGVSLSTIYKKCEKKQPLILLIKTDQLIRLGAFITEGLSVKRGYYGSGEMFVFHFAPYFIGYRWSKKNKMFISCSNNDISIGFGKNQGASIYIGKHLQFGYSEPSDTFDSPCLSGICQFRILEMEIWHIAI